MARYIDADFVRSAKNPYDEELSEYERGWNDYRAELLKAAYANGNTYLYYGDWAGTLYRPPNNSYVEYNYCVYNATGFYIPAAK